MLQYFDEFYMTDDQGMIADQYREVHQLLKTHHGRKTGARARHTRQSAIR